MARRTRRRVKKGRSKRHSRARTMKSRRKPRRTRRLRGGMESPGKAPHLRLEPVKTHTRTMKPPNTSVFSPGVTPVRSPEKTPEVSSAEKTAEETADKTADKTAALNAITLGYDMQQIMKRFDALKSPCPSSSNPSHYQDGMLVHFTSTPGDEYKDVADCLKVNNWLRKQGIKIRYCNDPCKQTHTHTQTNATPSIIPKLV